MSRAHRIVTIAACATALALGAALETVAQNMFQALQYDQRVVETTKSKKLKKYGTRQFQSNAGDGIEGEEITILYFAQAQPRAGSDFKGRGDAEITHRCGGTNATTGFFEQNIVAKDTAAFDKNGNVVSSSTFTAAAPCTFLFTDVDYTGNVRMTGPGTLNETTIVKRPGDGACVPDASTLCLNDDRFQVEVDWDSGPKDGSAVPLQHDDDSGLFFFLDPGNTELLIKVLDGCNSSFNSFWVFAAGATDVEFTMTVTDTQSGQVKSYFNPLGSPADAILDTQAFATCP